MTENFVEADRKVAEACTDAFFVKKYLYLPTGENI
jgi:hypothetical protein